MEDNRTEALNKATKAKQKMARGRDDETASTYNSRGNCSKH